MKLTGTEATWTWTYPGKIEEKDLKDLLDNPKRYLTDERHVIRRLAKRLLKTANPGKFFAKRS